MVSEGESVTLLRTCQYPHAANPTSRSNIAAATDLSLRFGKLRLPSCAVRARPIHEPMSACDGGLPRAQSPRSGLRMRVDPSPFRKVQSLTKTGPCGHPEALR